MAWTEQCKINFKAQIDHKKEQGYKTKDALVELSNDSGIPIGTLKNWLYPDRHEKYEKSGKRPKKNVVIDTYDSELAEQLEEIDKAAHKQKLEVVREIAAEKKEIRAEDKEIKQQEDKVSAAVYDETPDENIQILHGDFYEMCMDMEPESIDLLLTDPPYPKEFLYLWNELSEVGARVLKPGGFCIAYSGQIHLPSVLVRMSTHLDYYWTMIVLHSGRLAPVHPVKMNVGWKPIVIFNKPPRTPQNEFLQTDIVSGAGREKDGHEWQQALGEFEYLVKTFSNPNDLILDVMMGAGTTLLACRNNQRRVIGIDIDEKCVATTKARLLNE